MSNMKQISDKITLIPLSNITAQYKQQISLSDESKNLTYTSESPVKWSQSADDSDSGLKYDISHTSVCKNPEILHYNNKNIVACMYTMHRNKVYVGTIQIPAKVIVTPYEKGLYEVTITVSLPYPIDF